MRRILLASAFLGMTVASAFAADVKQVQMLHWWTSGGEAAALNVLKGDLERKALPGRTCRSPAAAATPP